MLVEPDDDLEVTVCDGWNADAESSTVLDEFAQDGRIGSPRERPPRRGRRLPPRRGVRRALDARPACDPRGRVPARLVDRRARDRARPGEARRRRRGRHRRARRGPRRPRLRGALRLARRGRRARPRPARRARAALHGADRAAARLDAPALARARARQLDRLRAVQLGRTAQRPPVHHRGRRLELADGRPHRNQRPAPRRTPLSRDLLQRPEPHRARRVPPPARRARCDPAR